MSDTHGKFIWVELMTPEMEQGARFYGHVAGWQTKDFGSPEMPYLVLEADGKGMGGIMELTEEHKGQGIPPNWTGYVGVDDVDATAKLFAEKGGSVRRPPQDIPEIGRFAVVADPSGAVLCIMTPLPMETGGFPQETQNLPGHVGWYELATNNVDDAIAFYGEVFGWTKDHDFDMGAEMGPYRIFAHNGKVVGGMMKCMAGVPTCYWGYYFNVDGIDEAITRVSTGGGKVVNGPMEVPGESWIVNCQDPQGAFFSLLSQKK
jgi:predicted enzyme related to lactoylglutathione lyase